MDKWKDPSCTEQGDPNPSTIDQIIQGREPSRFPKRWTFAVRLEGETTFFPCSAFAIDAEAAKAQINGRYKDQVVEFREPKEPAPEGR